MSITIIDALAVHRLTRLVTADDLTGPIRDGLIRWAYDRQGISFADDPTKFAQDDPNAPRLAQLVTCRWCASTWLAGGFVLGKRLVPKAWGPVSEILALSSLAALIAGLED